MLPNGIETEEVARYQTFLAGFRIFACPPKTVFAQGELDLVHEVVRMLPTDTTFAGLTTQHLKDITLVKRELVVPLCLVSKGSKDLKITKVYKNVL